MFRIRVFRPVSKLKKAVIRRYSQPAVLDQNEYTETPEYPPILDMSNKGRKLRRRQNIYENIKNVKTVEEKQIAINMPRYYGWQCVMLHENKVPFNAMPMIQAYTRSHFAPVEKLPDFYNETASIAEDTVKEIKSLIEDAISIEHEGVDRQYSTPLNNLEESEKENAFSKVIVRQVNRIITNNLTDKVLHVLSAQVDYDPRHEAFWFVGGVDIPTHILKWRSKYKCRRDHIYDPVNRPVQYLGAPFVAIRSPSPLRPLIPYSEAENPEFKVPNYTYVPQSAGYFADYRHGTNIPGFWPGDRDEFGFISFHGRGHILSRDKSYGPEDNLEALHCQGILNSFGWLLAQASYQGFTTFNDLTYPLVTQTVITNGQLWSLYAYQLNTITMHIDEIDNNPKHNICFGTKPLKLYDTIENGKVQGLNEDVLKMLVQFYLNSPEEREHEMKPFLGEEEQVIADIEDDNKRCWLEARYKHMVSNRPKHLLLPETYHWEKIYKIQHNTRFFERKVRPFETGGSPFKRRLDDHLPPYIPKALRPYPRHKKKFESTYYPDV